MGNVTHCVVNHAGQVIFAGTKQECREMALEYNNRYQSNSYHVQEWRGI